MVVQTLGYLTDIGIPPKNWYGMYQEKNIRAVNNTQPPFPIMWVRLAFSPRCLVDIRVDLQKGMSIVYRGAISGTRVALIPGRAQKGVTSHRVDDHGR